MKIFSAIAAAVAAGVIFAPAAHAEPTTEFLNDLTSAGFNVNQSNRAYALSLGMAVCVDLYNGRTVRQEMTDAVEMGMDSTTAAQFIAISVADLCPNAAQAIQGGQV